MTEERRRHTDPLMEELLEQMKLIRAQAATNFELLTHLREEVEELKSFMDNMNSGKKAFIWVLGILAVIGGLVTWCLDLISHIKAQIK